MSKTDKTRPTRVQMREATEKYGEDHINFHTDVTFSRIGGDKWYMAEKTNHKYPKWRKNDY
jgi:hypothetical protein